MTINKVPDNMVAFNDEKCAHTILMHEVITRSTILSTSYSLFKVSVFVLKTALNSLLVVSTPIASK